MSKKMKERSMGINPNDEFFVNPNSRQARRKNGKPKGKEVIGKLDINFLRDVAKSLTAVQKNIPFVVELYHGGEQPDEVRHTFNLQEARAWALGAEHSLIMWDGKEVKS